MTTSVFLAAWAVLATPEAQACGGFFCDTVPVDQAAERILFAMDDTTGKVEVQVQISFEGDAKDFAWVLPVPAEPELTITVDDVFVQLRAATRPAWNLTQTVEGECRSEDDFGVILASSDTDEAGGFSPPKADGGNGVTVVGGGPVGPYETEILLATTSEGLLAYLQAGDYILPDDLAPKLAPYVATGSYFVALRLQKDKTSGDLRPLALSYDGTEAQIPLQLTAIAATPDMRLQPYVLGSARAVPENYLHVTINEITVDWLRGASNYDDVITRAANAAGGQAFATDFAGSAEVLEGRFWSQNLYNVEALAALGTSVPLSRLMDTFQFEAGFPLSAGTAPFLEAIYEIPPSVLTDNGITELQFFSCPDCFGRGYGGDPVDAEALAAALELTWLPAMKHAQELADGATTLTALTSSMDAAEMTVDPQFVLNPDMPDQSNQHSATLVVECGNRVWSWQEAPRRLVLADGRALRLPAEYATDPNFDYDDWLGELADYPADTVEQTARSGGAVVITDNRGTIQGLLDEANTWSPSGCGGCQSTGGLGGLGWVSLGLLGLARRRRSA